MKIYLVGGAVRDKKLGFPVKEHDWVVVGATISDMQRLGYRQVGKEFPVFLHPQTREEYALARTERKIDRGYKGFTFDTSLQVTLEEDLERRDLTINAMAETPDGQLIDPYHGMADLQQKILRHVSPAFAEDPVRILRVGRFFARYAHLGFHIAPETITLMQTMTAAGEVDALVAERVWKELERALGEQNPEKFFAALDMCGALPILFPAITLNSPGMAALQAAATLTSDTAVRFAALLHAVPHHKEIINALSTRYRAPNAYRELALLTAAQHAAILSTTALSADDIAKLFNNVDIYRRLARYKLFLLACQAIACTRSIDFDIARWLALAEAARSVDVQALLAQGLKNAELAQKIKEKRKEKITQWLLQHKN